MRPSKNLFVLQKKVFFSLIIISISFITCKKTIIVNNYITNPNSSGLVATPSDIYSSIPTAELPTGGGILPSSYFIDIPSTPFNQGQQGSCASCATAMAKSIVDHVKNNIPYQNNKIIYSPSYLFHQVNLTPNNCKTGGSYLSANFDILKTQGVCKLIDMPYSETDCTSDPTSNQRTLAASNKINHYFKLDPINTSTIKQFINIGLPVIVGFKVDDHFMNDYLDPANANKVWSNFGTYQNSAHATLLYGWDDSKNAFRMLNQWGNQWGDNGSIWVDYNLVNNNNVFFEAYIIQNGNVASSNLQITGDLNFGNTTINTSSTKTIQLVNNSSSSINVSNVSITSPFSISWNHGTIGAGTSQAITITFNPTAEGNASSTLTVTSNAPNSPTTIDANGIGVTESVSTKIIALSGSLSFGNLNVGETSSKTLTITNNGNSPLNVSSITSTLGEFYSTFSGTIAANSSQTATIYFKPTNGQSYNGTITVNSDYTSGTNTIAASGTGIQTVQTKIIALSGSLSFGNVNVGETSSKTITIANSGNSPMYVSSITSSTGEFYSTFSGTIPANSSQTATIYFIPGNAQSYNGTITVNADNTSGTNTKTASGTGIQTAQTRIISLSGSLSFGNVNVGETSFKTITIANNGNSPMYVSSITSSTGEFYSSFSGTIPANSSQSATIYFTPGNAQSYNATITVNADNTSGINTKSASGTGISNTPTTNPTIGTYGTCASAGSYPCGSNSYTYGTISSRIVSINISTHEMVFEIKKCDGTKFNSGGTLYVDNFLCNGSGHMTYGAVNFSGGVSTVKITITDDNMVSSKPYLLYIYQSVSSGIYLFSAPTIVVYY